MKVNYGTLLNKINANIEQKSLRVAAVESGVGDRTLKEFAAGELKQFDTAETIASANGFELQVSFVPVAGKEGKNGK